MTPSPAHTPEQPLEPAEHATATTNTTPDANTSTTKKEIKTFHCRFCSHLLLASTRSILSATTPLARRAGGARDRALILDIPSTRRAVVTAATTIDTVGEDDGQQESGKEGLETRGGIQTGKGIVKTGEGEVEEAHYTIPLATLLPDSKPVVVRRDDGFEKRVLFRCGRCRVVVGYEILQKSATTTTTTMTRDYEGEDENENENEHEPDRVLYLLPGSLVGTEDLQGEGSAVDNNPVLKQMEAEWAQWVAV